MPTVDDMHSLPAEIALAFLRHLGMCCVLCMFGGGLGMANARAVANGFVLIATVLCVYWGARGQARNNNWDGWSCLS